MTKVNKNKGIVFVNPPISLKERHGKLSAAGSCLPPSGLCYLAAVTRDNGFDTRIVDCMALGLDYENALLEILRDTPKYVGITASTISIFSAAHLAEMIKSQDNTITIIIGGPHITAVPQETMIKFPQFDIGVIGEGELTIIDLLKTYDEGGNLEKINGIIFRENNQLKITNPRAFIKNLDSLPMPAWDLLPYLPKYYYPSAQSVKRLPSISLVTARGCPGKCIFCDRKVFGNYSRAHSANYVIKMIKHLYFNYGIKDILIADDTFVTFKDRLVEVCQTLIQENLDLSWSCLARVDYVNPKMLKLMKKAGCWQIDYGIESASQEILDFLKKGTNLPQIEQAVRWTKESRITSKGFFMIGCPLETEKTIVETIAFAKKLGLDDFQITFFTPFPGSEIYEIATQYGTFDNDWKKMNEYNIIFVPNCLTRKMIEKYHREAFKQFYLRPKIVLSYLKKMRRQEVVLKLSKVAYSFVKDFLLSKNGQVESQVKFCPSERTGETVLKKEVNEEN